LLGQATLSGNNSTMTKVLVVSVGSSDNSIARVDIRGRPYDYVIDNFSF
jgi:hypothetical protein